MDECIVQCLKQHPRGATLKTLLNEVGPKVGNWPTDAGIFLQFAMYGHMERMKQNGLLRSGKSLPIEYALA